MYLTSYIPLARYIYLLSSIVDSHKQTQKISISHTMRLTEPKVPSHLLCAPFKAPKISFHHTLPAALSSHALPQEIADCIYKHVDVASLCALSQTCRFYRDNILEDLYREKLQKVCPWFEPQFSHRSSWRECAVEYSRRMKPGANFARNSISSLTYDFETRLHLKDDKNLPIEETHLGNSWLISLRGQRFYTSKHGIEYSNYHNVDADGWPLRQIRVVSFPNVLLVFYEFLDERSAQDETHIHHTWKEIPHITVTTPCYTKNLIKYFSVGSYIFLYQKLRTCEGCDYTWFIRYLDPEDLCGIFDIAWLSQLDPQDGEIVCYDGLFYQPRAEKGLVIQARLEGPGKVVLTSLDGHRKAAICEKKG